MTLNFQRPLINKEARQLAHVDDDDTSNKINNGLTSEATCFFSWPTFSKEPLKRPLVSVLIWPLKMSPCGISLRKLRVKQKTVARVDARGHRKGVVHGPWSRSNDPWTRANTLGWIQGIPETLGLQLYESLSTARKGRG